MCPDLENSCRDDQRSKKEPNRPQTDRDRGLQSRKNPENPGVSWTQALGHEREEPAYYDDDPPGGADYEALSRLDDAVVTRGLSPGALAALAEETLAAPLEDPITRDAVPAGRVVVRLACGHAFLREGLEHWFRTSRICPVCRLEIEA